MDVQCERCKTEYEFDDALVSGRGTTVKCTNCGHQFKIRRDGGEEDRWVVTGRGGEQIYRSLRELQKAILARQVSPSDTLVRGSLRRELGAIAELVPFFEERRRSSRPPPPGPDERRSSSRPPPPPNATPAPPLTPPARSRFSTTHGFPPPPAPLASGMTPSPLPPAPGPKRPSVRAIAAASPMPPPPRQPAITQDFGPEPDTMRMALRSTLDDDEPATHPNPPAPLPAPGPASRAPAPAEAAPYAPPIASSPPAPSAPPPLARSAPPEPMAIVTATPPPPMVAPRTPPPPRAPSSPAVSLPERSMPIETSSPLPPPTAPVRAPAYDDDAPSQDLPPVSHGRRPVGGFVVALVVVLALGGFGAYWAKQNLLAKPPVAATDPRVAEFVGAGEKALAEGNLDLAKENYDKASTLAEKDQRVLVGAARLAAMRADMMWLKSRLLPPDATDEQRATRDALADLTQRARRAADDAVAAAPDDPAALRAKIDALRIAGDRDGARALVGKVIGSAAQPETAYVLAALDLAEPEPLWSSVLERLRLAAGAEQGPGRGRALLVYALARAGEVTQARGELDRLQSARPHPLARELKAFVAKATPRPVVAADGGLALAGDGGAIDVGSLPLAGGASGGPTTIAGDPKQLVAAGEAARQKGDFDKARMLYSAALDRNPNDSEALNGLAEIAHAAHDLAGARNSYRRVLGINPSYLPALIGLADVEWESGDVASAQRAYKDIVDRFPEGSYPARVKQRAEPQGTAPTPTPTPSAPTAPSATTAPTSAPTAAPTEEKP